MSKKPTKHIQKKDQKQIVLLPFSQQYNSQDSLFNENDGAFNSQFANNIFNKPINRDSAQYTSGGVSNNLLNIHHSIFQNEWENDMADVHKQESNKNNISNDYQKRAQDYQFYDNKIGGQDEMQVEEEEDQDMYEPEVLLDKRMINGQVEYLVKWVEFSKEESTWEPAENIQICAFDLIQQFEETLLYGGKKSQIKGNKSPILTPTQRKQMPSPNLSRSNNQSQLSCRSPMRKNQVTPQTKNGLKQQESNIPTSNLKGAASPYLTPKTNSKNNIKSDTTFQHNQFIPEMLQVSKKIQNDKDSRVFDQYSDTNQIFEDSKKQQQFKNLTPKNNKQNLQAANQDANIKQVFNSEGDIIFEQKRVVDTEDKYYNKNKSPLLQLVKESHLFQKLYQNNDKSPIKTPNKQNNQLIYHTPVNQKDAINSKSPIASKATPQQNQKQQQINYLQNNNETDNKERNQFEQTPTQKGRGRQNKQVEIPPSPIMTPTPDVAAKSPNQKVNRRNIYKEIEISHDLLKSPIGKTPLITKDFDKTAIPQSPPIIFDQKGVKKSNSKRKRLQKRIEISDDDDSDIENIETLEKRNQIVDDIVPVFAEYSKVDNRRRTTTNSRSVTVSTTITPKKQQRNVTPNNKNIKTPVQSKQDNTPINKRQDLTPKREEIRNQDENKGIITTVRATRQNQQITPNKPVINSIWSYKKVDTQNQQQSITPTKTVELSINKTPLKSANKSPINKKDPKSPISKNDPKSPIKKQDLKSPISKTMEVEENSKRKRRRQFSYTSDDELTPIRQDQTPTRQNLTPMRQERTPLRENVTPSRRSNRSKEDQLENQVEKQKDKDDIQNLKESYQVHMKLRENRVQLQQQLEQINSVLESTKDNLSALSQMKFNIQKQDQQEDLVSRVQKKFDNIAKQQQLSLEQSVKNKNTKQSNFETPKKDTTAALKEKSTPQSKQKNSRQGSTKKTQKIDPKANIKKNSSRSATKDNLKMDIENEDREEKQVKHLEISLDKHEKQNKESQSSQKGDKENNNQHLTPNSKANKGKSKKEEKIDQKNQEKQDKLNNQLNQVPKDQEIQQEPIKEILTTPVLENKRSTRTSSRLSNIKQDNSKTPNKEEQQQAQDQEIKSTNQIITRRSQGGKKEKDIEPEVDQEILKTPQKQQQNSKNQKVDPKGRSTRSSIKNNQKDKSSISTDNTPIKDIPKEQSERKENSQKDNKKINNEEKELEQQQSQNKLQNISKIINIISQKKQKRSTKFSKNNPEYPQFEVEYTNGKNEIVNYKELLETQAKMIADFLIKDYL